MNLKHVFIFFFFCMNAFAPIFSQNFHDKVISDSIEYINSIVEETPEIIKFEESEKLYLHNDKISAFNGELFISGNKQTIHMPKSLLFADQHGYFLSRSRKFLAKKLFKNICYDCKYEWEGGVFTTRCPNCGSYNIGNVPNW